jgi:hypothetical protein
MQKIITKAQSLKYIISHIFVLKTQNLYNQINATYLTMPLPMQWKITRCHQILLGYQPCQFRTGSQCFTDLLCSDHQRMFSWIQQSQECWISIPHWHGWYSKRKWSVLVPAKSSSLTKYELLYRHIMQPVLSNYTLNVFKQIQWNLDASFPLPSFSCKFRLSFLVPELVPYK